MKLSRTTDPSSAGIIIGWVNDCSKEGNIFSYARAYAEEYDPKLEQKEETAKADLASKQSLAIPLIVAWITDQQVADEIGVSRQTIVNWRNNDTRFMQELQETKARLRQAQLVTLSKIVDKAFKTVEELLGDVLTFVA